MTKLFQKLGLGLTALLMTAVSFAAPVAAVDVDDAVDSLTNQIPSITAVAMAALGLTAVIVAIRWVKRAFS